MNLERASRLAAILALVVGGLALGEEPRASEGPRELLARAAEHRDRGRNAEAARLCDALVKDARASREERIAAWRLLVDALQRDRRHEEALAAAKDLARAFPGDRSAERLSALLQGDSLRELSRGPEGLRVLRRFVARSDDAEARLRMAEILLRIGRDPECIEEARRALALASRGPDRSAAAPQEKFAFLPRERTDAELAGDALRLMAEAAWRGGDPESCASAIARLLEPGFASGRNEWELRELRRRRAECLVRLGRPDEARSEYMELARTDSQPRARQEWAFLAAQSLFDEGRFEEAHRVFERVFTVSHEPTDLWPKAQRAAAEALREARMYEEALRAARVLLDTASHPGALADAVRFIAELLADADGGSVKRANAFILFQRWGPAGPDGEPGTGDDLVDPLAALGYPPMDERARALAGLLEGPPETAQAFRRAALARVWLGRPAEAAALFLEALRRAPFRELRDILYEAVTIGLRGARGSAAGLDAAFAFVAWGPAGPDEKPGTSDDIADPFAGIKPGGVPSLPAEDAEALRAASGVLEAIVGDAARDANERREAAWALERVHEALGDWGRPGLLEWYTDRLLGSSDGRLQEPLMAGALASARLGRSHLGGVREFLRELGARLAREGKGLSHEAERQRQEAARLAEELSKLRRLAPELGPMKPRGPGEPAGRAKRPHEVPRPRPPDATASSAPSGLEARPGEAGRVDLAWRAAADPESGVAFYVVWRDGEEIALTGGVAFTDTGIAEESTHVYEVSAVNGVGMESERSPRVVARMPRDVTPPRVESVSGSAEPTQLLVSFSEPVEAASACERSNYWLDGGAEVRAASLLEDGKTVLLTTSPLAEGATYALAVTNVRDRARAPNRIAPGSRVEFTFVLEGDGLSGVYYDNADFTGRSVTRVDPQINFSWGDGRPHPDIEPDTFSVRWTGFVRPERDGKYTFTARTDDGVRLWVAGTLIIDQWRDQAPTESSGSIELRGGTLHALRMDYYENGGGAEAILYWSSDSMPREVIPRSRLYSRSHAGATSGPAGGAR